MSAVHNAEHAVAACGEQAYVAGDANLLLAVDGEPEFASAELRDLAARTNPAAACLEAFRRHGDALATELRGSFALAIVDPAAGRALLAIDRFGIRPLAFACAPQGGLVFASTATGVAAHPAVGSRLDPQGLFDYSYFHIVPSPRTIFGGVYKLEPAHDLRWHRGRVLHRTYWNPKFHDRTDAAPRELAVEFLADLRRAVGRHRKPGRSATFLSGGIDSSTITGLLAEHDGRDRPAYTVGFAESGYDETHFAQTVATHFGAELRVHYITTREVHEAIPVLAKAYDEPFGNSSAVPALICARRARIDGIEHMLAGDGGDELFAGNVRYARQRVFDHYWRLPGFMRGAIEGALLRNSGGPAPLAKLRSYLTQARMPMPDRMESYNFLVREGLESLFTPSFLRQIDPQEPLTLLRERYAQADASHMLDRMLYLDWKFTLADNDLRKVTVTCERAGVAVSFPWLADELAVLATRVPATMKMRGTKLRAFVKQALSGFLPQTTLTKSKHGFGLPFGEWLKKDAQLQQRVYALLSDLRRREVLRPEFLDHLVEQHRSGHAAYYGTMVWIAAMLEGWLQAHRIQH